MARAYPKREWLTDYESFCKQLSDDEARHYYFLMVMKAEKERRRIAQKEARGRLRRKEAAPNPETPGTVA